MRANIFKKSSACTVAHSRICLTSSYLDVSALFLQLLDQLCHVFSCGRHQRRQAELILGVNVSAMT